MKLTKATTPRLKLPPGRGDVIFFDDELPGFGLRIRAGGKRVWIVQYRFGLKQRRVTLGDLRKLDADAARVEAKKRLAKVTLGTDPQREKIDARAKAGNTVHAVIDGFLAFKHSTLRPKTFIETRRYLKNHWKSLHAMPINDVRRSDVAGQLTKIAKENGATAAARARAALSALFAWAMGEGIDIDQNPVIGTNRPPEPRARDRVLSNDEIADIWHACRGDDYGRIIKLLLLTGARRDEIGGLTWQEVDTTKAAISLPSTRTKNHLPHLIPLSPNALEIIREVSPRSGRSHLFGEGPLDKDSVHQGFLGWSKAKKALDQRILARRIPAGDAALVKKAETGWRVHDLRRTVSTGMGTIGVLPHVIEAVINHVSGHKRGVSGVYNRAKYEPEVKAALELWAEHLESIVRSGGRA
jgi:integrase